MTQMRNKVPLFRAIKVAAEKKDGCQCDWSGQADGGVYILANNLGQVPLDDFLVDS